MSRTSMFLLEMKQTQDDAVSCKPGQVDSQVIGIEGGTRIFMFVSQFLVYISS